MGLGLWESWTEGVHIAGLEDGGRGEEWGLVGRGGGDSNF